MSQSNSPLKRTVALVLLTMLASLSPPIARAQSTLNDQLRKVLSDPEAMKELEKTKNLAPVELFKSQVLPNDVLTYLKPNHWSIATFELRSNQIDYDGTLETSPLNLEGMPQNIVYHRDARLTKGKRTRLTMPLMLPRIPKEIGIQLRRSEAVREDELWNMPLRLLEPHQMLIPVLTKGPNDAYNRINVMKVMVPLSAAHGDAVAVDRQRYYRFVLPSDPALPLLPNHPLTWTAISHVIWDGMEPEKLSVGQQEAMIDWIHWGGQLIVVGGAGPSFTPLLESFIGPYLPGKPSGQNALLNAEDLIALSRKFYPPAFPQSPDDLLEASQSYQEVWKKFGHRYELKPSLIPIEKDKPLYLQGIAPNPGSSVIAIGRPGLPPLAVEARVGRGRITMIGLNLVDPTLLSWPGYETLIRRVVLRRVEEHRAEPLRYAQNGGGFAAPRYDFLNGPSLTWTRIHARDLGAPTRRLEEYDESTGMRISARQLNADAPGFNPIDYYQVPVAEWIDSSAMPDTSRKALQEASGIEIPNSRFVLKVILGYILCLVPINWLVCRYGLGRREWAWVIVPLLAFGFAIVVERAAAYDIGYDSTCDEINLVETHGNYGRGHVSRFGSLYTTGRVQFSLSYPEDPTALVLPMSTGRSIRGEDVHEARFQVLPSPALTEYLIQPRSLSMFRAEQLATLDSTPATLVRENGAIKVVNSGQLELKNAVLIELKRGKSVYHALGTIAPKATVEVKGEPDFVENYKPEDDIPSLGDRNTLRPADFLDMLVRSSGSNGPEDVGELRLIAWTDQLVPGQVIAPAVDRHRGFTLFVAHLKPGDMPSPDAPEYDIRANGPETMPNPVPQPPPPNIYGMPNFGRMGTVGGSAAPGAVGGTPGAMPSTITTPAPAMPTIKALPGSVKAPASGDTTKDLEIQSEDYSAEKPRR